MLFQSDYNDLMTPEMDVPKTGLAGFLNIMEDHGVALLKLNVLFMLGCLPVVTIPLSLFAMSRVVCKMILDQPVKCARDFLESFRRDWKKGYAAFFLTVLPMGCAGVGMRFYFAYVTSNLLFVLPFLFCSTVFLVTLLSSGYLYALLGREMPMREALRWAPLLGVSRPLRAVLATLCSYGLLLLEVLFFPLSGLFLVVAGFSFPCLLGNFYLRTVLNQLNSRDRAPE